MISAGLAVTQKTLCPGIFYQIPENPTINVESTNINLFSPLSAVWISMLLILWKAQTNRYNCVDKSYTGLYSNWTKSVENRRNFIYVLK
jgi:hypothetical protein